jgi:endoglucanase
MKRNLSIQEWLDSPFFKYIYETPAPSGYEHDAVARWLSEAGSIGFGGCWLDVMGNGFAAMQKDTAHKVLVSAHIDRIGALVTKASGSTISCTPVGSWNLTDFSGARFSFTTPGGGCLAISGIVPPHFNAEPVMPVRGEAFDLELLGMTVEGQSEVHPGVWGECSQSLVVQDSWITGRGLDNSLGVISMMSVMADLVSSKNTSSAVFATTVQEEIGFRGSRMAALKLQPSIAIVLDAFFATDQDVTRKYSGRVGETRIGCGPILITNPSNHRGLANCVIALAARKNIPLQRAFEAFAGAAETQEYQYSGARTVTLAYPVRNMHTPLEVASLDDLQQLASLVKAIIAEADDIIGALE